MFLVRPVINPVKRLYRDELDTERLGRLSICVAASERPRGHREPGLAQAVHQASARATAAHHVDACSGRCAGNIRLRLHDRQVEYPARRVGRHNGAHPERRFDVFRGQHICRNALGHHDAFVEQRKAVTETGGKRQVVDGRHCGHAAIDQSADDVEELRLVTNVQVGRRLVEQQQPGFLRQRPGHEHALALASRKGL